MKYFLTYLLGIFSFLSFSQVDLAVQKAHSEDIVFLEFSESGRYLVSMGENNEFVIWDLRHEKSLTSFDLSKIERIEGMKFSYDESELWVKTARTTFFYDIAENRLKQENIIDSVYRKTDYHYDINSNYETKLRNGVIRKKSKEKKFSRYKLAINTEKTPFTAFDLSQKTNLLAAVAGNDFIYIYDYNSGLKKKELKGHSSAVKAVSFSANGRLLATAGSDRSIIIWDTKQLVMKTRLSSNVYRKKTVEFSHDGKTLYVGDELGYIYSLNLESAFPEMMVSRPNLHAVNQIVKNKRENAENFFIVSSNNFVYLKKIPTDLEEEKKYKFREHSLLKAKELLIEKAFKAYQEPFGEIEVMAQSPDGKHIIYTGDSEFPCVTYANVSTGKKQHFYNYYNPKKWKDLGFTSNTTFVSLQDSSQILYSWKIDGKEVQFKTDTLPFEIVSFEIIEGEKMWLNSKHEGQFFYDLNTRIYKKSSPISALHTFKHQDFLIMQTSSKALVFYDLKKKEVFHQFVGHQGDVTDISFHKKQDKFVTSSDDGTIRLWSLARKKSLVTIIPFSKKEFIFITSDNYYLITKGALDEIGFREKATFFYPEQFDLKYNRPDIVLQEMGFSSKNLIQAYRKAYLKRLTKMKFTEEQISGEFHLPISEISNLENLAKQTAEESISLKLNFTDDKFKLDRINLWINGVAIGGVNGIDVRDRNTNVIKETLQLDLAEGKNKIEVSVFNQVGAESYKSVIEIERTGEFSAPDLYVVSIGTSKHKDNRYDLKYADKDAEDVVQTFRNGTYFKNVNNLTLTNEEVQLENLGGIKTFLDKARINDVVLVFIAGHGVLNENFDYFFATHDMDFDAPDERGVPYERIEKFLDGIKALKKLLFIDTCHSGELDKEEVQSVNQEEQNEEEQGGLIFRAAGESVKLKENPLGLKSTNELMKSLFTDLRKGTGATVISSSGGVELAIEGNKFNNGLFTYCLLNGLTSGDADLNHDKMIFVSELQKYVEREVNELSNGLQTPTSRIRNNELDYRIW